MTNENDHNAGLAAAVNDTGSSTTDTASLTISREAAEDALQHAWNAGVAGAWRCVREKFAKGQDVREWALSVERLSPTVAAEWQQARQIIGLAAPSLTTEVSSPTAASPAQKTS